MRFPPSLLDEIRARLPVSQVVSRKVALKRAGREFKGLSPFKQERTPSFTVSSIGCRLIRRHVCARALRCKPALTPIQASPRRDHGDRT